MSACLLVLAILAPWAAGCAIAARFSRNSGSPALLLGSGWLIGQIGVAVLLYATFLLTGGGHARWILGCLTLIGILLIARPRRKAPPNAALDAPGSAAPRASIPTPSAATPLCVALAVLLTLGFLVKLVLIIRAAAIIPIRGDDAISIWLFKAKVIATLDQLPRDPAGPYYMGGSFPHYPVFVPLLAAWAPLVVGSWSEGLAVVPWPLFYLNLFLVVAGGCRRWMGAAGALALACLVTALPILAVHAYRPGYADLITACFLCGGVYYLTAWRVDGRAADAVLGIVFLTATACTKREGIGLAVIVMLWAAACTRHRGQPVRTGDHSQRQAASRFARAAIAITLVVCAGFAAVVLDFGDQAEALRRLEYHPEAWPALARHLFEYGSFGPAWLAVLVVVLWSAGSPFRRRFLPELALTLALVGFVAGIFLLTPQVRFALNDQTPSRLFMQVLPAIMMAWGIALGRWSHARATEGAAAHAFV